MDIVTWGTGERRYTDAVAGARVLERGDEFVDSWDVARMGVREKLVRVVEVEGGWVMSFEYRYVAREFVEQ